ncbi:MAG: GntR family transcriptional regulator [Thermoguttaceae bacterium]|jgi:DNA-binding LacI/PurR family transcriptional regulator|nr:GntR family transcriptional regulator [Thermoguttaceae bacterium]
MPEKRLLSLDLRHDDGGHSKHRRLKEHLVAEMVAGRLKPGERIPSEHRLVRTLGVARTTVRQAMASLERDGLIRRIQGKGTFVDDDARRKLNRGQDIFALVTPETRTGFYPSLLHGFDVAAGELQHQTMTCNTGDNVDRQGNIVLQLLDKEVGGVAIVPTAGSPTPAYQIRQLQQRGIPVVFCHRRVEGVAAPLLALPLREAGYLAGKVLAERGHRRVALFSTNPSPSLPPRVEGFNEGLRAGGCEAPAEVVHAVESMVMLSEESIWESLQRVFSTPNRPTAIHATFDSMAEMLFLLLPRLGLRVPEDVSLLGFGGAWREGALTRRLSSVVVDELATGRQAVSLLNDMRRGMRPLDDNTDFVMELGVSDGETLASPGEDGRTRVEGGNGKREKVPQQRERT